MIFQMIGPLFYSLLLGGAWSVFFKKKFLSSLAPAFMAHIILVLLSGLIFERLSIGIYGGIVCAFLLIGIWVYKEKPAIGSGILLDITKKILREGGFVFLVFYCICFVTNIGKRFLAWDEFYHWGMFIKECIRLDRLYCMSELTFAHKDYVPAITLFEVVWCKLAGTFSEPNAYRAIQVFLFSLLMPIFEKVITFLADKNNDGTKRNNNIVKCLLLVVFVTVVLITPLIFFTGVTFFFYHSIYCDIALGILFFYCVFESYIEYEDRFYQLLILTIGLSVLCLTKMTAIAFLPLVFLFLFGKIIICDQKNGMMSLQYLSVFVLPVLLWAWYNRFVSRFDEDTAGIQSYKGMDLTRIIDVFFRPSHSSISYLGIVKEAYFDALIHRKLLIYGSYIYVLIFIALMMLLVAFFSKSKQTVWAGVWTILSGIYYAMLMYFLYATSFPEYEAVKIASYERYMNTFVIAIVYFLIAIYLESDLWREKTPYVFASCVLLALYLVLFHRNVFEQCLPGSITKDNDKVSVYTEVASQIISQSKENEHVFIVKQGDNGDFIVHQRYYCFPRVIEGGNVGPLSFDEDIWSLDYSKEELFDALVKCDYLCFEELDEAFIEKYSDVFENPAQVEKGMFYKIKAVESKIALMDVH